jgi:uncharacterized membrane protein YebE (DUF533 family)
MADMNQLLGQLLGSSAVGSFTGGLAGNLLTSKSGRKIGKSALKMLAARLNIPPELATELHRQVEATGAI